MKRILLLGMVVLLVATMLPMPRSNGVAYAQDEAGLAPCSDEEIQATSEGLVTIADSFDALSQLGDDPASDDYLALLAGLDAADYEYWNTFYDAVPECLEAQQASFVFGLIINETLSVALLYRLGAIQTNEELSQTFNDAADARLENLNAAIDVISNAESLDDLLPGEWPACSEVEGDTAYEALKALYDAGDEVAAMGEEAESLLPVIVGYEALTTSYWNDVFPLLPQCAEVQAVGYVFGFAGEDILISLSIAEIAQYEANNGNAEVAQIFADSATQRINDFEETGAFLDDLFGDEEMTTEETSKVD